MEDIILKRINEHIQTIGLLKDNIKIISCIADAIINCYKGKNKLILCGNGGSCCDSMHIAGELAGRYYINRKSLPALALNDSCILTAIGNDFGYEFVFEKQLEGLIQKGDVVIGISTSGNSPNVLRGIEKAKSMGAITIGFTGEIGGKLKDYADIVLHILSKDAPRIQEGYMLSAHIICEIVESNLFAKKKC